MCEASMIWTCWGVVYSDSALTPLLSTPSWAEDYQNCETSCWILPDFDIRTKIIKTSKDETLVKEHIKILKWKTTAMRRQKRRKAWTPHFRKFWKIFLSKGLYLPIKTQGQESSSREHAIPTTVQNTTLFYRLLQVTIVAPWLELEQNRHPPPPLQWSRSPSPATASPPPSAEHCLD